MEFKEPKPENKKVEDINIHEMEYRLGIFLTEILKVKLDRGDLYSTIEGLKPEYRSRLDAFEGLSVAEKEYIRKRIS